MSAYELSVSIPQILPENDSA